MCLLSNQLLSKEQQLHVSSATPDGNQVMHVCAFHASRKRHKQVNTATYLLSFAWIARPASQALCTEPLLAHVLPAAQHAALPSVPGPAAAAQAAVEGRAWLARALQHWLGGRAPQMTCLQPALVHQRALQCSLQHPVHAVLLACHRSLVAGSSTVTCLLMGHSDSSGSTKDGNVPGVHSRHLACSCCTWQTTHMHDSELRYILTHACMHAQ